MKFLKNPLEIVVRFPLFFLLISLAHFPASSLYARVILVPADSTTIQGEINGAVNGDTVMVSPGTYTENIDFGPTSICKR